MRVALVTQSDLSGAHRVGGAETSMLLLARMLSSRGHRVTFVHELARKRWRPGIVREQRDGVHLAGIVRIRRSWLTSRLSPLERLREWIDRRHILRVLRSHLIDDAPDIVYSYYQLGTMGWIAQTLPQDGGPRWMLRIAGLHPVRVIERVPESLARYCEYLERVDCFNFIHADLPSMFAEQAATVGLPVPERSVLIGDIGVELPRDLESPVVREQGRELQLVMVARFSTHQKRHDLLVDALGRMRSPARVTFVGEGPQRAAIESRIAALGLSDRTVLLDQMPQKDLWDLIIDSDLLCVATDYEGLSKITIEAMALGTPVIASAVPPLTGLLEHDRTGFLVENDPSSWARELDRLAVEPALTARVAAGARRFVVSEYDATHRVADYERAFDQLMGR